jgi:hypothetical protein
MSTLHGIGFENRAAHEPGLKLRPVALAQLIATLALALCTLIAATAVSIGFARATVAGALPAVEAPLAGPAVPSSNC